MEKNNNSNFSQAFSTVEFQITSGGKDNIGIKLYDNDLQLRKGFADILRLLGKEKDIYCSYCPSPCFTNWFPLTWDDSTISRSTETQNYFCVQFAEVFSVVCQFLD